MARVLAIHHDKEALQRIALTLQQHEFLAVDNLLTGVKYIPKVKPDVIVIGHDKKKQEALRLLYYLRDNTLKLPVVVVLSPGAGEDEPRLHKLGARHLLEQPVSVGEMNQAIQACMVNRAEQLAGPRPITQEELRSNLSVLENTLNKNMKCFAGRNQVFLYSVILGGGARTRPRIALRCPLRAEYGMEKLVYYEYIRDICCTDPGQCEAFQRFQAGRESA